MLWKKGCACDNVSFVQDEIVATLSGMAYLDFRCTVGTQTPRSITVEQPGQKIPGRRRNNIGSREMKRLGENLAVHLVCVFVVEWWQTCQHLVEQYAKRPPIHRLGVTLTVKEFWCKVFRCTAEGVGLVLILHIQLAETEVAKCNVANIIDNNVLRLEITVNDAESV